MKKKRQVSKKVKKWKGELQAKFKMYRMPHRSLKAQTFFKERVFYKKRVLLLRDMIEKDTYTPEQHLQAFEQDKLSPLLTFSQLDERISRDIYYLDHYLEALFYEAVYLNMWEPKQDNIFLYYLQHDSVEQYVFSVCKKSTKLFLRAGIVYLCFIIWNHIRMHDSILKEWNNVNAIFFSIPSIMMARPIVQYTWQMLIEYTYQNGYYDLGQLYCYQFWDSCFIFMDHLESKNKKHRKLFYEKRCEIYRKKQTLLQCELFEDNFVNNLGLRRLSLFCLGTALEEDLVEIISAYCRAMSFFIWRFDPNDKRVTTADFFYFHRNMAGVLIDALLLWQRRRREFPSLKYRYCFNGSNGKYCVSFLDVKKECHKHILHAVQVAMALDFHFGRNFFFYNLADFLHDKIGNESIVLLENAFYKQLREYRHFKYTCHEENAENVDLYEIFSEHNDVKENDDIESLEDVEESEDFDDFENVKENDTPKESGYSEDVEDVEDGEKVTTKHSHVHFISREDLEQQIESERKELIKILRKNNINIEYDF